MSKNIEFKDNSLHMTKAYLEGSGFAELKHQGWAFMLSRHPELVEKFLKYSQWEDLDGSDWVKILSKQAELAKYCNWSKLHFSEWKLLFAFSVKFADKCPWSSLEIVQVDELLRLHPELASYAGIENPHAIYVLNNEPDEYDAVNLSMSEVPPVPIFAVMAYVLQRFFDYSADSAKKKTAEIYSNHKTLIAVHSDDFAKYRCGLLHKCLKNGGLPLTCTFEPVREDGFKLELRSSL